MFGHQDDNQTHQDGQAEPVTLGQSAVSQPANSNNANANSATSYSDNLPTEPLGDEPAAENEHDPDDNDKSSDDDSSPVVTPPDSSPANDDLLDIKKQALEELSPLVGHLDQNPEEKFKTTMMMIQGNDNQSLIPDAYHAAKNIADDKARARALLDIVNEINYFTHKS